MYLQELMLELISSFYQAKIFKHDRQTFDFDSNKRFAKGE